MDAVQTDALPEIFGSGLMNRFFEERKGLGTVAALGEFQGMPGIAFEGCCRILRAALPMNMRRYGSEQKRRYEEHR